MYCANIKYFSASDGPGVRTAFLCSGCRLHCKGCHNPETHDFKYGQECTDELLDEMIEKSASNHVCGLSVYGGEPLDVDNQEGILHVIERWKEAFPDRTIWLWTGYTFDQLKKGAPQHTEFTNKILNMIDVLVEGPFIEAKKNVNLHFRGSENQRILSITDSKDGKRKIVKDITKDFD